MSSRATGHELSRKRGNSRPNAPLPSTGIGNGPARPGRRGGRPWAPTMNAGTG